MKKERFSPPAVGGTSLLVSFAVLLLTMLALLSLSQARSDRRLAEKTAENVRAYYAADLEAQKTYARLRSGEDVPGVTETGGRWCCSFPITQYQTLFVEIDPVTLEVLRWQTISHPEAPNENLPVWAG